MKCPVCGSALQRIGFQLHFCRSCQKVFLISVEMVNIKEVSISCVQAM